MELGQFEEIAVLGTGALAVVKLMKRQVGGGAPTYHAMKIMDKKKILKMKQLEHIHNEKELLKEVEHPFVIALDGTFQDAANVYIILEYCHGGDLFGLMGMYDDEKLPVEHSRFYGASIASVFICLHEKNIIYRDLKTENLLLDRAGYLKVADFGFAKKLAFTEEHGYRTWTLCGTPEHLAPEIIQNKGHNQAADWWTLGINLYEFLAGFPPFNDVTPIGTYRLIIAGKYEFPAGFDKDGEDLIRLLLHPDPDERLTSLTNGGRDVMDHPFFKPIDFDALKAKKIDPPFEPEVEDDEDISNFEEPEEPEDDIDAGDMSIDPADFAGW